ncbi:tetratricopeptide repeat protein [Clostridium uliginosum]|uniref:Tetratricopeptide repeat-containing protein n=1 Tax=Clostridium uliginosum TaxID=119641 RepID=A0A1I1K5U6_9CLOT|nr:tetratricopeptide repeat protein [Clostridium uliginosum]SFC55891.1 Tetratricopeptide repeat-containing protein [Clostridium uliginosum]
MNYFNEGNKLYNTQDYLSAIDCYKKSAVQKQNEACSYYNAGVCFIKLKDFNKAILMLKNAIAIQHESKYFFNLGYCYSMKEDLNKALQLFNIAWSLNNTDKDSEKAINLIISKISKNSI